MNTQHRKLSSDDAKLTALTNLTKISVAKEQATRLENERLKLQLEAEAEKAKALEKAIEEVRLTAKKAETEKVEALARAEKAEDETATAEDEAANALEESAKLAEEAANAENQVRLITKIAEEEAAKAKKAEREKKKAEREKEIIEFEKVEAELKATQEILKAKKEAKEAEEMLEKTEVEMGGIKKTVATLTHGLKDAEDKANLLNTAQIFYSEERGQQFLSLQEIGVIRQLVYEAKPKQLVQLGIMLKNTPAMFMEIISSQLKLLKDDSSTSDDSSEAANKLKLIGNSSISSAYVELDSTATDHDSQVLGASTVTDHDD